MAGEVYVAGENLTDTDYEYRPNYPMPGATCMVGIQLKF
jgi:iron complex outermembrane receptor protein